MRMLSQLCILSFVCIFIFCNTVAAQVPVSQEPRHHNVFQNEYVRLLDVRIQPGDTTQIHVHALPSVFIRLSNVKSGSQVISEEQKPDPQNYDGISFDGFYKQPRIHRVWNSDTVLFHVLDVELLKKDFATAERIEAKNLKFLFEEKPVIVYRSDLEKSQQLQIRQHKAPLFLIALTESTATINYDNSTASKTFSKGDFFWIDANKKITLENNSPGNASFAVLEFK